MNEKKGLRIGEMTAKVPLIQGGMGAAKSDTQNGLIFCGANAYKAKKLEHVADIMREFEEELSCRQE